MTSIVLALALSALQVTAATPRSDVPRIDAALGSCSADFTVSDAAGKPVFGVSIKVRIRYGFLSLKRMDLDVSTNSDGKARVVGLPAAAKPLAYEATKDKLKATVEQDVTKTCQATYELALK
jgi:hypothetical protein